MNKKSISFLKVSFFAIVFAIVLGFGFVNQVSAAKSPSDHTLYGYVWSDNIGWISLNCSDRSICSTSNYEVYIDYQTGQLSGYGWSSNVGWISFDAETESGCPERAYIANCRPVAVLSSTGTYGSTPFPHILGWARVVNNDHNWDGWISLSCHNHDAIDNTYCDSHSYGAVLPSDSSTAIGTTGGALDGYAWGSTVLGWLDFAKVTVVPGGTELTLISDKTSVSKSTDTVTLTWDSPTDTAYTSCTASGGGSDWNGSRSTSFSSTVQQSLTVTVPNDPTTFKISCTTGSETDEATVDVDIDYVWDLGMTVSPTVVPSGGSATFTWATTGNVPSGTTCGAIGSWTASTSTSGNQLISNILSNVTNSYRCIPPLPDTAKTASASINLLKIPYFDTDACYPPSQGGPTLEWRVENGDANGCSITDPNLNVTNGHSASSVTNLKTITGGPGSYSISCTGALGSISVSKTLTTDAVACTPSYQMKPLTMCNGKTGQKTDNSFQPFGMAGQYKALVKVDSDSIEGFSDPLKYKFVAPVSWATNGWTINQWTPTGIPNEYQSPNLFSPSYNSTFEIIAPSLASLSPLNILTNKTQTFTVNGDRTISTSMPKSASYTICAPDGGSSKPIFIEQ